ncbi:MAG TPA: hypothetical protein VF476_17320 [Chitinophagaceae bacterium]
MKMIRHKTIAKDLTIIQPFISDFTQEKQIVFIIKEYPDFVVTSIVNMVNMVWLKMHLRYCLSGSESSISYRSFGKNAWPD